MTAVLMRSRFSELSITPSTPIPPVDGNSLCPRWNHTFSFIIHLPALALLRIVVNTEDTFGEPVFVAQACLPVESIVQGVFFCVRVVHACVCVCLCLCTCEQFHVIKCPADLLPLGYRCIPLCSAHGEELAMAKLLSHVTIEMFDARTSQEVFEANALEPMKRLLPSIASKPIGH